MSPVDGNRTAIPMRGAALRRNGLEAAGRIAATSGARLMCDTFAPRLERCAGTHGPKALSILDLHDPELDWRLLARGMGVEASRATTSEEFAARFGDATMGRGPRLIEVLL